MLAHSTYRQMFLEHQLFPGFNDGVKKDGDGKDGGRDNVPILLKVDPKSSQDTIQLSFDMGVFSGRPSNKLR